MIITRTLWKNQVLEKNKKFAEEIALNGHKKQLIFIHKLRSEQFLKDFF